MFNTPKRYSNQENNLSLDCPPPPATDRSDAIVSTSSLPSFLFHPLLSPETTEMTAILYEELQQQSCSTESGSLKDLEGFILAAPQLAPFPILEEGNGQQAGRMITLKPRPCRQQQGL